MKGKYPYFINYGENMGSNPAKINLDTGELSVNPDIWENLESEERKIILTHEMGHLKNDSANEILADKYLIEEYGINPKRLKKIYETIDSFAPDTLNNRVRKVHLLKNILERGKKLEDSKREASWVTAAIGAGLTIISAIAPSLFGAGKKSEWQKMSDEQKNIAVREAIKGAIYLIYDNNSGDWEAVKATASLSYSDPNSILSVAYILLKQAGIFENSKNNADSNPIRFWQGYFTPTGLTPQYWLGQIEHYKESVLKTYKSNNPIKSTISNIFNNKIMLIVVGILGFFIIKKIIK